MKNIISILKFTALTMILLVVLYPALIWGIAQFSSNNGKGETVSVNGKVVGYTKIGQKFDKDIYFWGRPSAVDYNAAGSGGSTKGATNPEYLKLVETRIEAFTAKNPTVKRSEIPAEMVTASGSGLDPDISFDGATIQVARIAKARKISPEIVDSIIKKQTDGDIVDALGPRKLNVLLLNVELDNLNK